MAVTIHLLTTVSLETANRGAIAVPLIPLGTKSPLNTEQLASSRDTAPLASSWDTAPLASSWDTAPLASSWDTAPLGSSWDTEKLRVLETQYHSRV